jgi:chaperonin GroES
MTTTTIKSATQIHPMSDRVVIRPKQQEEITKSGIILPDTVRERPQEGEVVAVGTGRYLDNGKRLEMEIKAGDKIIYSKYTGSEIQVEDEELLVIRTNDVLAKIS